MLVFLMLTQGRLACYPQVFLTAFLCPLKVSIVSEDSYAKTSDFIILASFLFAHRRSSCVVVSHHYGHLPLEEVFVFAGHMAHEENQGPD